MNDIDRENIQATNEEIEAAFEEHAGIALSADPEYGCDVSFGPASEMDAFRHDRMQWRNPGQLETDTEEVLYIRDAQALKGQRRRDVVLIRFGEYCAIYGMDN